MRMLQNNILFARDIFIFIVIKETEATLANLQKIFGFFFIANISNSCAQKRSTYYSALFLHQYQNI